MREPRMCSEGEGGSLKTRTENRGRSDPRRSVKSTEFTPSSPGARDCNFSVHGFPILSVLGRRKTAAENREELEPRGVCQCERQNPFVLPESYFSRVANEQAAA